MKTIYLTLLFTLGVMIVNGQRVNVPADYTSIQAAIEDASTGDTVLVANGTYNENIRFLGKAITVASHFIIDSDSSHISKTIIDGSNSTDPDTASTVLFISGEDTTSVLCGFTITGGKGSYLFPFPNDDFHHSGGGVLVLNSGALLCNNIIAGNRLDRPSPYIMGGGIGAFVNRGHTLIIRENTIKDNTVSGDWAYGGGMMLVGGKIVVENNRIINNNVNGTTAVAGAGLGWAIYGGAPNTIKELTIANNLIMDNSGTGSGNATGGGGGIFTGLGFSQAVPLIYNNIISNNFISSGGGAIYVWDKKALVYNNTIVNNEASAGANSVEIVSCSLGLFNNIISSDAENNQASISQGAGVLYSSHNLIHEALNPNLAKNAKGNIVGKPIFLPDSYDLDSDSPGIGWGLDSFIFFAEVYHSPLKDFTGSQRPHSIDGRIDVGAFESPHAGFAHIPDTAFLYALIDEGVDINGDGQISYEEAEARISINVQDREIIDMTGIEAFLNLKDLRCSDNQITNLDVSNNTALEDLYCSDNQITNLDVSNNTLLQTLFTWYCPITTLDVSRNTALTYLVCNNTPLTSLDVSKNTALTKLSCTYTQLSSLDVSNLTSLTKVNCWGSDLLNLNASGCSSLLELSCYENHIAILDISGCSSLESLHCEVNQLTSLDVSEQTELQFISCGGNLLTNLDVSNNTALQWLRISHCRPRGLHGDTCYVSNITSLDISRNTLLENLSLGHLPQLEKVCVWESFDINSIDIDTTGSPNVYFTTDCSSSTGIDETNHSEPSIYPNPTNDLITIETEYPDHYTISITTLNGQQILSGEMEGTSHQFDLSSFQKGIYFITVRSKDLVATRKIIKM